MKKKLAVIMSILLLIVSFSGCSSTQSEFYSKLKQTNKWKATDMNMKGDMTISMASGEDVISIPMSFTATAYVNNQDMQGYIEMALTATDGDETLNIPEIKMFIDKTDAYINKGYFTSIYTQSNEPVPAKLQALDTDYIGISISDAYGLDDNEAMNQIFANSMDPEFVDSIYSLYEEIANELSIDIPVTKDGTSYNIVLNENDIANQIIPIYDKFVNNIDSINEKYSLELTPEQITEIKSTYDKDTFSTSVNMFKAMFTGSEFKLNYDFKDENTAIMNMMLNVPITVPVSQTESRKMVIKANISADTKQSDVKAVELPTKVVKLTQQQLSELMMPDIPEATVAQ